jgi:hypothetical protein
MSPTTPVSSSSLEWNRKGFFALPEDTSESYEARARLCLEQVGGEPYSIPKYDLEPFWVPVEYSNDGLRLWEAACTWYGETDDIPPAIQLAKRFQSSSTYLGIYKKEEVLAHEYVHACRANLGSSSFEEIFSYLLSLDYAKGFFSKAMRGFRVALGPLFERTWEPFILIFLVFSLFVLIVGDAIEDSYNAALLRLCFVPVALLAGMGTLFLGARLILRWWQWWRCKWRLDAFLGASSLPLMVRLIDEEIIQFSKLCPEEIGEWIGAQGANFRWQLLLSAYKKSYFA